MFKILILFLAFSAPAFALNLAQVRADLKKSSIPGDSVEMNVRTTISVAGSKQSVSVFFVQKGKNKIYAEMKTPFMNQRSVVNGNRMKVVDLNANTFQVLPYGGETLEAMPRAHFNPLDSGEWEEPKRASGGLYSIQGSMGKLFYNAQKKRIEKLETEKEGALATIEFAYDAEGNLKTMTTHVSAGGVETITVAEILTLRHSRDFPDRLFEF